LGLVCQCKLLHLLHLLVHLLCVLVRLLRVLVRLVRLLMRLLRLLMHLLRRLVRFKRLLVRLVRLLMRLVYLPVHLLRLLVRFLRLLVRLVRLLHLLLHLSKACIDSWIELCCRCRDPRQCIQSPSCHCCCCRGSCLYPSRCSPASLGMLCQCTLMSGLSLCLGVGHECIVSTPLQVHPQGPCHPTCWVGTCLHMHLHSGAAKDSALGFLL
jgi:hypothetical protein